MGHIRGFIDHAREKAGAPAVEERIAHYNEFAGRLADDALQRQSARCMECGTPFCHALGCPLANCIPELNALFHTGRWQEALDRLHQTNNFPEFTGRVCPALCEAACTLSINDAPVSIRDIELAIVEKGFERGWVVPQPPARESGKKVAVIGSGPAGLAVAQQLRRLSHSVSVFERDRRIGGILRYGIPDFKLEKRIVDRRLDQLKKEGVEFHTDVLIGEDISVRYLYNNFDAICAAVGARTPRDINVCGRGRDGICFAMDYLKKSNMYVSGELAEGRIISAKHKNVLVIGGGDTGSDCVGTAIRQGAKKVYQFEILPRPAEWNNSWNPQWPAWPDILRTSTSHEEGCERRWAVTTKGFHGKSPRVEQGVFAEVEWYKDYSGRMKFSEKPNSEFTLSLDLVIIAAGFLHIERGRLFQESGIELDQNNYIRADSRGRTTMPNVFAAGDAVTGPSLIVRAIHQARNAAGAIHDYLTGNTRT